MESTTASSAETLYQRQSAGRKICILTILTALFAFGGWCVETVFFYVLRGEFRDRGLLTLPFCPLYGLGLLAVYLLLGTPQSGLWRKWHNLPRTKTGRFFAVVASLIVYAALAMLIASVAEYITGRFYDRHFHVHLWSYTRYENNLHGYVSLRYSLLWGALAVTVMGLVWYPLQNLLARVPGIVLVPLAVILALAISGDFIFNMVYLYKKGARYTPFEIFLMQILPLR